MTSIGDYAFYGCNSFDSITCRALEPPVCSNFALDGINKWTCTLYIPEGCIASYQIADQWKDFFFMQELKADASAIRDLIEKYLKDSTMKICDITRMIEEYLNR